MFFVIINQFSMFDFYHTFCPIYIILSFCDVFLDFSFTYPTDFYILKKLLLFLEHFSYVAFYYIIDAIFCQGFSYLLLVGSVSKLLFCWESRFVFFFCLCSFTWIFMFLLLGLFKYMVSIAHSFSFRKEVLRELIRSLRHVIGFFNWEALPVRMKKQRISS